ncbi:MAG: peptidoglycan-binding protein LysM [Thermoanaerobaculia bacterium]
MGLIDFIKNVGHKLDPTHQNAPAPAQAAPQGPSAQDVAKLHEKQTETALANLVNKMGFSVQDLMIDVEGSKVSVKGKVNSQEEKEKIVLMLGNSEGIGSVDDQLQVSNPQPEGQYYDVKAGDSLSKISKQFYGDANKYNVIFEANRPMLKNADDIYPGQKLRIPAMASAHA